VVIVNEDRAIEAEDRVTTPPEDITEPSDRETDVAETSQDDPNDGTPSVAGTAAAGERPDQVGGAERADASAVGEPLFPEHQSSKYSERWDDIQSRFVDDPRRAVEEADELVGTLITELETSFRTRTEALEAGWQRGEDASTEDLRLALQRYRSFFGRLLGA
jgi:hypothetical protein